MKKLYVLLFLIAFNSVSAQSNTEVYLLDIENNNEKIELVNLKNISNNKGYDNQPSFYDDNTIIFSSTREGQTDIAQYNIEEGNISYITNTTSGSEYSPLKIPGKEAISAIRLDTTGLQRLYQYDSKKQKSSVLLEDLKVGYHVWYNEHIIISSVLVDNRMDLVVSNLKDKTNHTLHKNVGRSLHKIPNTDVVSFISKEKDTWVIKSIHPISGAIQEIKPVPLKIEDMFWLNDGTMIVGLGKIIAKFNPKNDKDWSVLHRFTQDEINEISRIAVSKDGNHLAIVSEESPAIIVQKQVDTFNKADLDGFASCYSKNVVVCNFPSDTLYTGNETLKSNYKRFLANNQSKVTVTKRIVMGNKVIDQENAVVNGKQKQQVAIYEVKNGKIISMSFIPHNEDHPEAEKIVQEQLEAYNARNIDDFVNTFSDTVKAYDYPTKLNMDGKEQLQKIFSGFFSQTPDLHCEIKNRIVIGNMVIDEEFVTANGDNFSAVALYKINGDKIDKMYFIR
ncbi:nuclear transport factor 2 family protein [Aquimarina sp. AU474]|uniref:nuclear transport factor 2 family protein n=1 Tax=Aquimarina sp. AU474 TaxID=2108529 RepID=UPI000D685897|nr:nuclear transport factor 2 family protein [Aquimarina sp. AU474]